MLTNLAIGISVMLVCLFLQAGLIVAATRKYRRWSRRLVEPDFWSSVVFLSAAMLLLIGGNLFQIGVWALLFFFLGEFQLFSEAFYHSAVNFATLGYGDVVMSPRHKLLGPLEAINGALMIGMSTATLIAGFQDAFQRDTGERPP